MMLLDIFLGIEMFWEFKNFKGLLGLKIREKKTIFLVKREKMIDHVFTK